MMYLVIVFLMMFAIIIGLFNSYRNMVKQYNLQLGLNRKIMEVVKKRADCWMKIFNVVD